MTEADGSYYRRRADEERRRALESARADVAAIHLELARQYEALLDNSDLRPR